MELADRTPLAPIAVRARRVRIGQLLLAVVAMLFYGPGWALSKMLLAVAWCLAAAKVGWTDARRPVTREVP